MHSREKTKEQRNGEHNNEQNENQSTSKRTKANAFTIHKSVCRSIFRVLHTLLAAVCEPGERFIAIIQLKYTYYYSIALANMENTQDCKLLLGR